MAIHFKCPECGTPLSAPDTSAGLTTACTDCDHSFPAPPLLPKWKRAPDPADKRPAWARNALDDAPDVIRPSLWRRIIGVGLIVWGVLAAAGAGTMPAQNPAERAGQVVGGAACSLLLVASGVVLIRRSSGQRSG